MAAVRSLGRQGIPVATADTTRLTPAAFSKYCKKSFLSPKPADEPSLYAEWLEARLNDLAKEGGAVLLPMDDATTQMAIRLSESGRLGCDRLLPGSQAFETASDKYKTILKAQSAGIECPRTWLPENEEELTAPAAAGFPLVVKPRHSSGSRGIRIVHGEAELRREYRAACAAGGEPPMIQEYLEPGERFDAAVLFDADGEPAATFVQRELRHYPVDIGPSTAQESVRMPELEEQAVRLLQHMGWRGIAEVEWMRDSRDGRLKLMEVNPRYWNSLHLAIQSGVDFPYLHYQLARGQCVERVTDYRVGQITRNLLPGDLLHAWAAKKLLSLDPPLFAKAGKPIQDDIWSVSDPMASLGFAAACARFAFDSSKWKAVFKR